ncbi:hypothetical protein NXW15_09750 [Bacteroides thetaiotaomicron]|uniref:Uncharacterized protein n=1 Tax=Bacteroides thetaiotaomicron TaxID=818 RepID=A0A174JX85_BACT4|nr:hypothetical protein [Bacteroides thetaiotaomicron]MCS2204707.1 hypothetical protein [Bacteroides thetaiotaomicron]MCS2647074.1 hypothetical protein [Bacteroides thetaiotaomicron]MCS2782715.1 hypothetical protein [Bacteroides thetaiotaomicron]MCS2864488.1 hypothetical protein [Bacteroides thetaiotaomicron]MCS3211930.1 hypothetical protein [Bacteroides thetaiotaomicron]
MDDSTCCGTCLMKSDLQNSTDKFAFLKDNWPSFGQIESIDKLSKQELNCTLCFLNVLIDEFVNEKSACPNRVITRLVLIRIYVQNSMELMELKELQSEQEKSDGGNRLIQLVFSPNEKVICFALML